MKGGECSLYIHGGIWRVGGLLPRKLTVGHGCSRTEGWADGLWSIWVVLGRPDGMGSSQMDSKAVVCPVDMMGVVVVVDMNE